jgi:hypothetical protein
LEFGWARSSPEGKIVTLAIAAVVVARNLRRDCACFRDGFMRTPARFGAGSGSYEG